jgi:hypothetical protein
MLLRGFDKRLHFHVNISCPKSYHDPDHLLRIIEYSRKKLFPLSPRAFFFTVSSSVISFKDIRQDFTHSSCTNINSSRARSFSSG